MLVKNDDLWIATRRAGITRWNPTTDQLTSYTAMAIDKAKHKWFGTAQGLSRFDDNRWTPSTSMLSLVTTVPVAVPQSYRVWDPPHRVIDSEAERTYVRRWVEEIEKTLVLALADERLLATYDLVGSLGQVAY